MLQGRDKLDARASARPAPDLATASYALRPLAHIGEAVALRVSGDRIETLSIILHHDYQLVTSTMNSQEQLRGIGVLHRVMKRLFDRKKHITPNRQVQRHWRKLVTHVQPAANRARLQISLRIFRDIRGEIAKRVP